MLKFLNQDLFKEDLVKSSDNAFVDRCITAPDCVVYDDEHPHPDKPFIKIREFACENESDRKLNIRGVIIKNNVKTFRISSGDRNIGDDENLYLLAIPFRGYLDANDMPEWVRILKNRIVISTKYTIKMGNANFSKMLWLAVIIDKDKLPQNGEEASFTIHYFYPERTRKKGSNNPERFPTGKTVYVDRTIVYKDGEFTMNPEEPRVMEGEPERVKHPFPLYQFPDKDCLRFDKDKKKPYTKEEDSRKYDGGDKRYSNRNQSRNNGNNRKNGKRK